MLRADAECEVSKAALVLKLATGNGEKTVYNLPAEREVPWEGPDAY